MVLVATMVCLLIVLAMLGAMLLGALRASRQLHVERDLRQCELLLHAGVERAAFHLAEDSAYAGETWKIPAAAIIGTGEGWVQIDVSRNAQNRPSEVRIVAEYPHGSEQSIRRSAIVPLVDKMPPSQE
jgi:hypothetical protein